MSLSSNQYSLVQEGEREKLRLTLALQSLQRAHAFEAFSWQREEDVDVLEPPAARTCGCGSHAGHGAEQAAHEAEHVEPSEQEFKAAMREAQLLLDAGIRGINESLDEVQCALEELEG